jgi:hypothetical protein
MGSHAFSIINFIVNGVINSELLLVRLKQNLYIGNNNVTLHIYFTLVDMTYFK